MGSFMRFYDIRELNQIKAFTFWFDLCVFCVIFLFLLIISTIDRLFIQVVPVKQFEFESMHSHWTTSSAFHPRDERWEHQRRLTYVDPVWHWQNIVGQAPWKEFSLALCVSEWECAGQVTIPIEENVSQKVSICFTYLNCSPELWKELIFISLHIIYSIVSFPSTENDLLKLFCVILMLTKREKL